MNILKISGFSKQSMPTTMNRGCFNLLLTLAINKSACPRGTAAGRVCLRGKLVIQQHLGLQHR